MFVVLTETLQYDSATDFEHHDAKIVFDNGYPAICDNKNDAIRIFEKRKSEINQDRYSCVKSDISRNDGYRVVREARGTIEYYDGQVCDFVLFIYNIDSLLTGV